MNKGLSKRAVTGTFDRVGINVWCLEKKQIVFTGSYMEVANFVGTTHGAVRQYLRIKSRFKKKYAFRYAKTN